MSFKAFVGYALARFRKERETEMFRYYVTESLRLAPQGMYLTTSFDEVLEHVDDEIPDAEEIIAGVVARAGLVVE